MDAMETIKQTFFQECDELLADLETGLLALQGPASLAVLASPRFLFREEAAEPMASLRTTRFEFMRALTFQSIVRTSSPGWYSRTSRKLRPWPLKTDA